MIGSPSLRSLGLVTKPPKLPASRLLQYFDTLAPEVLTLIINQLKVDAENYGTLQFWHPYELFRSEGIFGVELRRSFTKLEADVGEFYLTTIFGYDFTSQDSRYGERSVATGGDGEHVVLAWNRNFALSNPSFIDSCRRLRSLELTLCRMNDSNVSLFDPLFAACGGTLEEITFHKRQGPLFQKISDSITRHCRSLQSLSVRIDEHGPSLLPLFQAIGGNLRRLQFSSVCVQPLAAMAECCGLLQDVELFGNDASFITGLQSPLQMIRLRSLPTIGELTNILGKFSNALIDLRSFHPFEQLKGVISAGGERLHSLRWRGYYDSCAEFDKVVSSLNNLKELFIDVESSRFEFQHVDINSLNFLLYGFFCNPKPKLRLLDIQGANVPEIFDYLGSKLSSLREFSCTTRCDIFGDIQLYSFLSANTALEELSISYLRPLDRRNACRASFLPRTAALIRSLKRFPSIRLLTIDGRSVCSVYKDHRRLSKRTAVIADACVGLRGRGVQVEVNRIQYLK